jgi:protein-disulfide isomerase
MPISRRVLLSLLPLSAEALSHVAQAQDTDQLMALRTIGSPGAPVSVTEYFSLTCPHCARFQRETFPQIKAQLVDTGKLRYGWVDYPLDQVALMAAQVARYLPPDRYEPFIDALLASQDRWAYARGVNSTDELAKMAALAGLPREKFDQAIADVGLRNAILEKQDQADKTLNVDSTPTFIFSGPGGRTHKESGEMSYDQFAKIVAQTGGATG